ncbi:MAG TPA: DUF4351 domain-containing protein [Thermoanaerobaculia bacterium]|nr:DUF4351 domain-containing protein [Thermoanaerobaculia bacterium]
MANQHDKIFKQLLRVFLGDFLRLVAPEALERLDLSAPEFLDKELFADNPHSQRLAVDLLARVRTTGGSPFLIHAEVEARARGNMPERLWRYRNQILARYDTAVLSIVMNLTRGRPGVSLETWESLLGPAFPEMRYVSFGLERCKAAEYLARPEPLAWALAALMNPRPWSRAELKMACLRRIAGLRGRADSFLLVDCVENYLQLKPREVAEFEALGSRRENTEVRAMKMTWSETLVAEGQEKGRTEGMVQGKQSGACQLLLHLLGKRFGPLPENVRRRVEAITSLDVLTELAERVLSAHSLEEMGLA